MPRQEDRHSKNSMPITNFGTPATADGTNESSIENEYHLNWPYSEQQARLCQGSDARMGASPGTHDSYYITGMQPGHNEFDSSYALGQMDLVDASVSPGTWPGDYNTSAPLPSYDDQTQVHQETPTRPWTSEDWTFIPGYQHQGEEAPESAPYQYVDSFREVGVEYSTSEASQDPSSNLGRTGTTNTSWGRIPQQHQFQNPMDDSLATLKALPDVYTTFLMSRSGSAASVMSAYSENSPGIDDGVERARVGNDRWAPRARATSRLVNNTIEARTMLKH